MLLEVRLLLAIFAGGCAGALARAGLIELAPASPGHWPWVTFGVNVAGSALLGWIATHRSPADRVRAVVGTGFCGALTTFSTMQLEVLRMLNAGRVGLAVAYVGGSVVAGLAGVTLGARTAPAPAPA
ncbi:MAG: Camphor resistance CrcB protein [Conexibacter sp.]|nr:Camphor resistance CrcB protein [Conexibacter sp.]